MHKWLARQINTNPRASPGLVVSRLCLWFFTAIWGGHALFIDDALKHPVYGQLALQDYENGIGALAMLIGLAQIWRLLTHNTAHAIGFTANVIAVLWYSYLISAMFVLVPLAGPIFSASMSLMCILSIVSLWHDTWLTTKTFSHST